jgi:predicted RNase H-like HicB family nuclease
MDMIEGQAPGEKFSVSLDGVDYEFEPEHGGGGYIARVPAYPPCSDRGDTFEEALKNIKATLKDCINIAYRLHLPIPDDLQHLITVQSGKKPKIRNT